MKGRGQGFVEIEELGGGKQRYAAGWRHGVPLVFGTPFNESDEPDAKLVLLRAICRELRKRSKPLPVEYHVEQSAPPEEPGPQEDFEP
jgi:hypothetical protein